MANIIDISYFEGGELNIAGTEQAVITEKVNGFIAKYEPDYLLKALGYPLWKLFKADHYPAPVTARFIALLDGGAEFTDNRGCVHLWTGLKIADPLFSPIANYVYYWFLRDNVSFATSMGEVKGTTENASPASSMIKQMRAWNEMVDYTDLLHEYLKYAVTGSNPTYPEYDKQIYELKKISIL